MADGVVLPPIIARWLQTYNANDVGAHIDLYTDDASIVVPGLADLNPDGDKKVFREVEEGLDRTAPGRQLRIDWASHCGRNVCIDATLLVDPEQPELQLPLCVHFTTTDDGEKIVRDRTYVDSALQKILS